MTMPEASVDEDASSIFPHDEVGMSGKPTVKEAVSESLPEEEFPHYHLRLGVLRPDGGHHLVPLLLVEHVHDKCFFPSSTLNAQTTREGDIDGLALEDA